MRPEDFLGGGGFTVESADAFLGGGSFETQDEKISRLRGLETQAKDRAAALNSPAGIFKGTVANSVNTIFNPPVKAARSLVSAVKQGVTGEVDTSTYKNFAGEEDRSLQAEIYKDPSKSPLALTGQFALDAASVLPIGKVGQMGAKQVNRIFRSPVATKAASFFENRAQTKNLGFAQELTSRKVTGKVAEDAIEKGSEGYTPPTLFRSGKLNPTPKDNLVAESVAPYVDKSKSLQGNIDSVRQGISQINSGVRGMIADNKVPFNLNQLRTRLSVAKEDSKLLFAGDTASEKAYDAIVDEYVKFVSKGKKDTLGLFDSRQAFDNFMQSKLPNAFKKDATGQYLDPRDNIRINAFLDIRRAANEYVAEQLPKNNPYRKALMRESYMIDALGRIAQKNTAQLDKSKIQLLASEYPVLKWLVGGAAAGTFFGGGVGVGGAILNSPN